MMNLRTELINAFGASLNLHCFVESRMNGNGDHQQLATDAVDGFMTIIERCETYVKNMADIRQAIETQEIAAHIIAMPEGSPVRCLQRFLHLWVDNDGSVHERLALEAA